MSELRIRLIERLCRVPAAHLPQVEVFLKSLEKPTPALPAADSDKAWPHAPLHRLSEHGTFIVTASTLNNQHLFRGQEKLTLLEDELLRRAKQGHVRLEAWAVFSNHYHFVAHTTGVENELAKVIADVHSKTATEINRLDGTPGRQVWFNFRDTALTFESSYFARLNYVHHNAVKHRLVPVANQYRWCWAAWFERTATKAQIETIYGFKYDRLKIEDDYEPMM